jgi:hypothetical protein
MGFLEYPVTTGSMPIWQTRAGTTGDSMSQVAARAEWAVGAVAKMGEIGLIRGALLTAILLMMAGAGKGTQRRRRTACHEGLATGGAGVSCHPRLRR